MYVPEELHCLSASSSPYGTSRSPSVAESEPSTLVHELSCSAARRLELCTEGCASMYLTMPSKLALAPESAPAMVAVMTMP